jgi:hypothetical protein
MFGIGGISDIPIVGGIYDDLRGNPDAIKAAYDKAIAASAAKSARVQSFLMGAKGQAQQYYAPLQHMFQSAYGTEGIEPSRTPGFSQSPLTSAYGGKR